MMNSYVQVIAVAAFIFILSFFLVPKRLFAQSAYYLVKGKVIDKNN